MIAHVIENVPLAERTYRIRLDCPQLAQTIRPGQFLMLRLRGTNDPLLGRPFALYDIARDAQGQAIAVDVVYLVVGKMTRLLGQLQAGADVEVIGPLGNGFNLDPQAERLTLVAGGIGQTPFLAYARHLLGDESYAGQPKRPRVREVLLYYGVRTASLAAGVADFQAAGVDVRLTSDDGTLGERGFVTARLAREGIVGQVVGCGPEPMLHSLASLCAERRAYCQVSLETPMACGVGICFSCVVPVKTPGGWDYKRCCVEGPVFDADRIVWTR